MDFSATGIPDLETVVKLYGDYVVKHSNGALAAPSLNDLDYYLAFSFFKFCGILQVAKCAE